MCLGSSNSGEAVLGALVGARRVRRRVAWFMLSLPTSAPSLGAAVGHTTQRLRQGREAWRLGSRRRSQPRRRCPARTPRPQDVVRRHNSCQRTSEQTVMGAMGSGKYVSMAAALTLWTTLLLACGQARLPVHPQPPGRDFLIIGHRGAPQQACENTLASFETALHLGANALELDLSLTRDQQVVVWHDWRPSLTSVLRPTGLCRLRHPLQPQPIHDVPLHEALRDYGYEHNGHHVPLLTFTEFVQHVGPGYAGAVRVSGSENSCGAP